ncbi:MAG: DUF5914 domain-containing protein [Spirochaetales bacterium]
MKKELILIGKPLPPLPEEGADTKNPDWKAADLEKINRSFRVVQNKPTGGWYVLGSKRTLRNGKEQTLHYIEAKEILLVRFQDRFYALSNLCPHMGAPLSIGNFDGSKIRCAWHGLTLDCCSPHIKNHLSVYDDGFLIWVCIPGKEALTERPFLPQRPEDGIDAVYQKVLRCSPSHVILNRLDPWHGAHFHPHTFARLKVYYESEEEIRLRVAYRVWKRFCVEVDARFHCPDARTIVMTILEGDGAGSVVETHATPIAPGYTLLTELTLATSDRKGFRFARNLSPLLRPFIQRAAGRLWREDSAYAERRYYLEEGMPYSLVRERKDRMPVGQVTKE